MSHTTRHRLLTATLLAGLTACGSDDLAGGTGTGAVGGAAAGASGASGAGGVGSRGTDAGYFSSPQAVANRDLTRVLFASTWGGQSESAVRDYLIQLPSNAFP